jgi:uncharacterized paraquat-inducible protein A
MNTLKKAYRTTALIGLWMMASAFIIALVVELVTSQQLPITIMPILPDAKLIKYIFFGAAAAEFVLIRFVNSRLLSNRRRSSSRAGKPLFSGHPTPHDRVGTELRVL